MAVDHLWPPGRPRVLLTDAWLANAGDAAIALALDRMVRELAPSAAVMHASYHWDTIGPRIPALAFVPPLEDLLGTPWARPARGWDRRGAALLDGADLVICQGGGFLVEAYRPHARLAALADVVRRGKRLALVGLTIGHFHDADARRYLGTMLRGAELVVVRDRVSLAHASEGGAIAPVLGTDLAFTLFASPPIDGERRGISVVLTDHHRDESARTKQAEVAGYVLDTVTQIAGHEPITLWSTVQGAREIAREDDSEIAASARAMLPAATRRVIALETGVMTPSRAVKLARSSRAVVTMRLHPAIFAAASGTPFALVLGDERVSTFAGSSLEGCVARPEDRHAINTKIGEALAAADGRTATWDALGPLRERLAETRAQVGEFIERTQTKDQSE